jgi:hypothetical protein
MSFRNNENDNPEHFWVRSGSGRVYYSAEVYDHESHKAA